MNWNYIFKKIENFAYKLDLSNIIKINLIVLIIYLKQIKNKYSKFIFKNNLNPIIIEKNPLCNEKNTQNWNKKIEVLK